MPPSYPTFIDLLQEAGSLWKCTLVLTLAAIIFAVQIVRNGWGMSCRLSLIPISFIPLLAGIGAFGWDAANDVLHRHASFGHGLTYEGLLIGLKECLSSIALTTAQTLLLVLVTTWTLLNYRHGPLAALINTVPATE